MMYSLVRKDGSLNDVISLAAGTVLIGKQQGNDVVLDDPKTPEVAVRLSYDQSGYLLENISLSPKVKLNGKQVKNALLRNNDFLAIGRCMFVFVQQKETSINQAAENKSREIVKNISSFSETIGGERNLTSLLEKTIAKLIEIIGGTDAFVFTIDDDGKPQVFISSPGKDMHRQFSDTIVQKVLASGEGICIPNAMADPAFSHSQSVSDLNLSSVLCCPIIVDKRQIGLVYLGSSGTARSYSGTDLDTLRLFSSIAGILICHVEYMSQQQTAIRRLTTISADNGIIGRSNVMRDVAVKMRAAAASNITVLLEGETGTGKDLIAEQIHKQGKRSGANYVVVNCSSLHGDLLESELFGHKKGSFTGAHSDHDGLFAVANEGTLFLDEIGEMRLETQARLLRTLETGLIRHVGSSHEEAVDARIICATNRNLKEMVDAGKFRQDLYYRLNQFSITIPPLRDREDDTVLLAYYFLEKFKSEYPSKEIRDFTEGTLRFLRCHEWPGNVRELANAVHKAIVMSEHSLLDIASDFRQSSNSSDFDFAKATDEFQKSFIEKALRHCQGNKEKTALLLGMSRSSLFRYLGSLGIS